MIVVTIDPIPTLIKSNMLDGYFEGAPVTGGAWTAGTYSEGEQVYYTGEFPHKVYESRGDDNTTEPPDMSTWKFKGTCDRDEKFDEFIYTQSEYLEFIEEEIDSSNRNYLFMANLQATEVELTQIHNNELMPDPDCTLGTMTEIGPGWSHNSGSGRYDCDGTQTGDSLLGRSGDLAEGEIRQVIVVVENFTAGTLTPYAGGTKGDPISADGSSTQLVTAGAGDTITGVVADADFQGSVSTLSEMDILKHEIIDMDASIIVDWPTYFLAEQEYRQKIWWEFPQYSSTILRYRITWKPGENAKVGIVRCGWAVEAAVTEGEPDIGINDFSYLEEDTDTGEAYLKTGNYSDDGSYKVWFDWNRLDSLKRLLTKNRGKWVVLNFNDPSTNLESLVHYCFLRKWRISVSGGLRHRLTIKPKGSI